jgi:hypothetical protein
LKDDAACNAFSKRWSGVVIDANDLFASADAFPMSRCTLAAKRFVSAAAASRFFLQPLVFATTTADILPR